MRKARNVLLVIVFAISVTSCKKSNDRDEGTRVQKIIEPDDRLIENAKAWFNANVQINNAASSPSILNGRQKLKKRPDWDNVYIAIQPDQNVVTVPLIYEKDLSISLLGSGKLSLNKQAKLLIFKRNGHYKAEVVMYIPNDDYLKRKMEKFSGNVMVEDWLGNGLRNYYAQNGKYLRLNGNSSDQQNRTAVMTCYYLNHYDCEQDAWGNYENCVFTGSEFLGC